MLPCEWEEQTKANKKSNQEKQDDQLRVSAVGGTDDHRLSASQETGGVRTHGPDTEIQ